MWFSREIARLESAACRMESHPLQGSESTETAKVQHAQLARNVATLLANTSVLGANLAHAAPSDGSTSGLEQIDLELSSYFAHSYELGQRLKKETFTVAVLALAKSGDHVSGYMFAQHCACCLVPCCVMCACGILHNSTARLCPCSAGKSTFLNAVTGSPLLPVNK